MQVKLYIKTTCAAKALFHLRDRWEWDDKEKLFCVLVPDHDLVVAHGGTFTIKKGEIRKYYVGIKPTPENASWVIREAMSDRLGINRISEIRFSPNPGMRISEIPEMEEYYLHVEYNPVTTNKSRPRVKDKPARRPRDKK